MATIYTLNFDKKTKNKYPVVYENGTFYYCKEYGSDYLKSFRKGTVYSINTFKEKLEKGTHFRIAAIYIEKGVPDFSFISGFSHEELAAREKARRKKDIELRKGHLERTIENIEANMKREYYRLEQIHNELIKTNNELLNEK